MNNLQTRDLRWRYVGITTLTLITVVVVYWYFCWGAPTTDVLPIKRAIWNLVKFVFREENGREEAIYG
jgi:hypothetical protein